MKDKKSCVLAPTRGGGVDGNGMCELSTACAAVHVHGFHVIFLYPPPPHPTLLIYLTGFNIYTALQK
jgi:hypothetical protein